MQEFFVPEVIDEYTLYECNGEIIDTILLSFENFLKKYSHKRNQKFLAKIVLALVLVPNVANAKVKKPIKRIITWADLNKPESGSQNLNFDPNFKKDLFLSVVGLISDLILSQNKSCIEKDLALLKFKNELEIEKFRMIFFEKKLNLILKTSILLSLTILLIYSGSKMMNKKNILNLRGGFINFYNKKKKIKLTAWNNKNTNTKNKIEILQNKKLQKKVLLFTVILIFFGLLIYYNRQVINRLNMSLGETTMKLKRSLNIIEALRDELRSRRVELVRLGKIIEEIMSENQKLRDNQKEIEIEDEEIIDLDK